MNREEIFSAWALEESPWSPWVKPVLFAHIETDGSDIPSVATQVDVSWAPPSSENVALVLDLREAEGVLAGVALAGLGYRPVPLYNALPGPVHQYLSTPVAAVPVVPIIRALRDGAKQLAQFGLPAAAPPAFLLDANRSGDTRTVHPDAFDNRSICFTTDFPSANFLASRAIRRAMLVQRDKVEAQPDLAHILRRWQDGGIALERKTIDLPARPEPFEIARPSWYGAMFQRALISIGFRRSWSGGFGAWRTSGG